MAEAPPIETTRLSIVAFSEEHLTSRYVSWLNDPDVVRYSDQRYKSHTLESCRDYYMSFQGTPNHFWAVVERRDGLGYIGTMTAYVDELHLVADVGILIGEKSAWGGGYASEAWLAVCGYLFESTGIRKITAGTLATNARMLTLMERTGMSPDGSRARHALHEGREVDLVHGALFREDWKGPSGPP